MAKTTPRSTEFRVPAEHRWPAVVGIAIAMLAYALLPGGFVWPLRVVVVAICAAMLIPLIVLNPSRLDRESRWSRLLSIGIGVAILGANQVALVQLIVELVRADRADGPGLLLASAQVWLTNVIAYSLIYWELDRGGPVARRREPRAELPAADFRFPQDENDDNVTEVAKQSSKVADWMPGYFDYVYFSFSNSMAFSATDVMPLTHRSKAFMLAQSVAGFVLLALVIARSVSLLGG